MKPFQFKLSENHHRDLTDWIFLHLKNFRVAIDGGAHHGILTRRFAKVFERVYSFEPNIKNRAELMKDLPDNVTDAPFALGNEQKLIGLELHGRNSGTYHVVKGDEALMVRIDDLPYLADERIKVDLIKLDVEGCEYHALLGAQKLIERCQPMIVVEDNSARQFFHVTDQAIPLLMQSLGYKKAAHMNKDVIYIPAA